ncbi:hypothetical protein L1987_48626 [Smallanthus sonchifolius]|uniref:Uncharacterized protein n=1 Tax=Smallanthus sonchifolius TaxID=185202 RepID=A0ACB9FRU7_9ASTR|nr:hypothetical protein L1987_48626 [Smallanthus sonchifolius]
MAMRKQSLSKLLRFRHHTPRIIASSLSDRSSPSSSIDSQHLTNTSNPVVGFYRHGGFVRPYNLPFASSCYRSFSTDGQKATDDPGFFDHDYVSGGGAIGSGEDAILPVRCLVWFLDTVHDLTDMPWWMVIIISTLALRVAILPVLLVQLRKLKKTAELAPKLPPPLPPPFSGKSWIEHYKRFRDRRKEIGCPSFLWILAYPSVQIPCFILGTASVRQIALDHHHGFECGGTLWFQNLIELSHGATGYIFPLLLASLHLVNVQVSFEKSSMMKLPNLIGVLAKYYRYYLQCLTIPIFFAGFYLPQPKMMKMVNGGWLG